MVNAFSVVLFAVTAIGIVVSFTRHVWPFAVAREIGHVGKSWMAHPDDLSPAEQPDGNLNDAPITFRPPRPRS